MKKILVTGAYGYIGSHVCKILSEYGYDVHALDKSISENNISPYINRFICHNIKRHFSSDTLLEMHSKYDAIVHLASLIDVEESMKYPEKYITNNINGTRNILDSIETDNFIFASTAAAFTPISVYAQTKLLAEKLVQEKANRYTIFRFFNVAGNNGIFKQIGKSTHLIRIAAETAAGKRSSLQINGTNWDTDDGTCVRDYIHVMDIVNGIVKSIHFSENKIECIGSGIGYSVKQVINTMKKVSNIDFKVIDGLPREGDAAVTLLPNGVEKYIDPLYTLEDMCLSAFKAECN